MGGSALGGQVLLLRRPGPPKGMMTSFWWCTHHCAWPNSCELPALAGRLSAAVSVRIEGMGVQARDPAAVHSVKWPRRVTISRVSGPSR